MELTIHVGISHKEESVKAQQKTVEEIEDEDQAIRQRIKERMASVQVEAQFNDVSINPFRGTRGDVRKVSSGPHASKPQLRCLWVLGLKDVDKYKITKRQASRMIGQFRGGASVEVVKRTNKLEAK
jgi:hypothetical protein